MTMRGREAGAAFVLIVSTSVAASGCASNPLALPAAAPAPATVPASSLLLSDDFNSYNPRWRQVRGQWSVIDGTLRQTRDEVRDLRVRVAGRRIQCWIADQAVANLEDESFTTGRIGLTTFRSKASFSFVRVTEH